MELKDLKTGMVVEARDGKKYLIINRDGKLCGIGMNCYMTLDVGYPHKSNMTWPADSNLDIMKVFKPALGVLTACFQMNATVFGNVKKYEK